MNPAPLLAAALILILPACQQASFPTVTILADNTVVTLQTNEGSPLEVLDLAGIALQPGDRLLLNGLPIEPGEVITGYPATLQVRRAVPVTIVTPGGEQMVRTSAFTVGEALHEAQVWLRAGDRLTAAFNSPIPTSPVSVLALRELNVTVNGAALRLHSAAATVGEALAEAGMPLVGADYSIPAEGEPLPADGQVRLVRVTESIQLAQELLPFESELQASADVPLDQTQILRPGEPGLVVQRTRIRYEDGVEASRQAEDETLVRPPQTRLLGYGTKIEVRTATVDGVQIEYWRAVQMYATSYSPCRSGTDRCYPGTSSGKSLRKGMVGLRQSWYLAMQGQQLYIPGYGFASVEDVCGGCVGRPWIDLGYSDHNYQPWSSWVTVYFLTPVPPNVIYVLE